MEKKIDALEMEMKRYAFVIAKAPSSKDVIIYYFDTKKDAEAKYKKLRSKKWKSIVKARDNNGRFSKGWVLICCK